MRVKQRHSGGLIDGHEQLCGALGTGAGVRRDQVLAGVLLLSLGQHVLAAIGAAAEIQVLLLGASLQGVAVTRCCCRNHLVSQRQSISQVRERFVGGDQVGCSQGCFTVVRVSAVEACDEFELVLKVHGGVVLTVPLSVRLVLCFFCPFEQHLQQRVHVVEVLVDAVVEFLTLQVDCFTLFDHAHLCCMRSLVGTLLISGQ